MNDERFNKKAVKKYLAIISVVIFIIRIIMILYYLNHQLSIVGDNMDSLGGLALFFTMPLFSGIQATLINISSLLLIALLWLIYGLVTGICDLMNNRKELKIYIKIILFSILSIMAIISMVNIIPILIKVL